MHQETSKSRPDTPESFLSNSFKHASSTIDDLTVALANFSRVPSPEPLSASVVCCCGKEDCESVRSWLELKSRLESRLILSAEVGQALLQRHEAYVRRHEVGNSCTLRIEIISSRSQGHTRPADLDEDEDEDSDAFKISELVREKAQLEKEARATISRLTAHHARSVGWETRLSTAMRERDDMQQERDGESNRAKLAENRFAAMKDKAAKLQSEVRRLQDSLEERRLHRLQFSDTILQDARSRLEALHTSHLGQTAMIEQTELTNVLESLVNDNETLKRDNAELQTMLMESREEIHSLQEEVEEYRVKPPSRTGARTPQLRHQILAGTVPGSLGKDSSITNSQNNAQLQYFNARSSSLERNHRRSFVRNSRLDPSQIANAPLKEPLTPETSRRPLSPPDSLAADPRVTPPLSQPRPRYASSHFGIDVEESSTEEDTSSEKPNQHKTLLLTCSRAVQTETWPGFLSASPIPSYMSATSPADPRSESSSFSETLSSNLAILLDRFSGLHNRLTQADALTLTNRLKRQHLKGADVGHLSRSTVNAIISEANNLRCQFRFLLEDESLVTHITRKDFRMVFKLFKEIFAEMGELRIVLNDVILDPSSAARLSEHALNPTKAEEERKEKERGEATSSSGPSSWIAPISKLFSPGRGDNASERPRLGRSMSGRASSRPPKFIPKLGPALSASATTVNVEFTGTAVGRSTTSTVESEIPKFRLIEEGVAAAPLVNPPSTVMDIFAGAPRNVTSSDPWVVVPKAPRRVSSFIKRTAEFNSATIRRSAGRSSGFTLSRDVDAVIDVAVERTPKSSNARLEDEDEDDAPLLQRTLRRRGLSDSSIHSTFTSHAEDPQPQASSYAWPDPHAVFQTLTRTMQTFTGAAHEPTPPQRPVPERPESTRPGLRHLLPNLTSWAAAGNLLETTPDPFLVGSVRDESFMPSQVHNTGQCHGDYF
ncbi:hypothetical protein H0H81_001931 [Sphagnurus paluster]|uniref:Uncharacterized protein n=1 Tax=Sphagnurus paluster TaxID=117069 RepID=A0A9P7K4M7_9AGAR|nr:hypothetical protein H0H81_001931 [Sphagnurus paluster]